MITLQIFEKKCQSREKDLISRTSHLKKDIVKKHSGGQNHKNACDRVIPNSALQKKCAVSYVCEHD